MRIVEGLFATQRILAWGLTCALATTCGPSLAFKPAYDSHGHTMITKGVLGSGYSFGTGLSGNLNGLPLEVPPFTFASPTNPSITRAVTSAAADMIVTGVQSRDWLGIDRVSALVSWCPRYSESGAVYFSADDRPLNNYVAAHSEDGLTCLVLGTSGDLDDPSGHFDNDNFGGSARSIRLHVLQAITYARKVADGSLTLSDDRLAFTAGARLMLGKAIHTTQDFYAHSSWAETHMNGQTFTPLTLHVRTGGGFTTEVRATLASPQPVKGQSPADVPPGLGAADADVCQRRIWLLPSVGWDPNGGNFQVAAAPGSPITTGAWWAGTLANYFYPPASDTLGNARCDHGMSSLVPGTSNIPENVRISGLAKDMPGWPLRPLPHGRVFGALEPNDPSYGVDAYYAGVAAKQMASDDATEVHLIASYQAALHTKELLGTVVEMVNQTSSNTGEAERVLTVLFGDAVVPSGNTWVIDRSGTMADSLPGIRTAISNALRENTIYALVDFAGANELGGQTDIVVTRGDASVIRTRLGLLEARGGGSCATPAWEAVRRAIDASGANVDLLLITDASASDAIQEPAVSAWAQAKRIRIQKYISGSCSPLDPSYEASAKKTGGTLNLIEPDGDALSSAIASAVATTGSRVVHTESATLGGSKVVAFPVESGVNLLSLVASGSVSGLQVVTPSGAILSATMPGVTLAPTMNGWRIAVANPQQGNWQVTFSGVGEYALSVYVDALVDFDVLDRRVAISVGRPGHEYRPPLAATGQSGRVWLQARVVGARTVAAIDLLRLDGSVAGSFPLYKMASDHFEGEVALPTEPVRFRVRGRAGDDTIFARIHGQGNVAAPAALPGQVVASMGTAGTWRAGTVNAFAINLKNLGGNDTVSFASGTLPTGATLTCNPTSLAVPGSEQVNVLCSIFLPEAPDRGDFSVVVSSTTAVPAVTQTVTIPLTPLKLPLSCALDIDGDNRVDPAVDGVLLTRYLLGFRGASLTNGLTIPGPRKTDALLSAFFGNAAQFDLVGRASPAPTATVDGLLMTRLMFGFDDTSLLNGINVPVGAQFTTAAAIKDNVVAKCAGGF